MNNNKGLSRDQTILEVIKELRNIIKELRVDHSVGLDIEDAGSLKIDYWKSEGYKTGGKFRNIEEIHLGELDQKAPSQTEDEYIRDVIEAITLFLEHALEKHTKPDKGKLQRLMDRILPLGGAANFAFNVLTHYNML